MKLEGLQPQRGDGEEVGKEGREGSQRQAVEPSPSG